MKSHCWKFLNCLEIISPHVRLMTTQFQINIFSFLCTQDKWNMYLIIGAMLTSAHSQHNYHSLCNSSNSAVERPQAPSAGRCMPVHGLLRTCTMPVCAPGAAAQWRSIRCFQHVAPGCCPGNLNLSLDRLRADHGGWFERAGLGGRV